VAVDPQVEDTPPRSVLDYFRIRVTADLGGRVNRHWLVDRSGQSLVLRRWPAGLDAANVDWEVRLLRDLASAGMPVSAVIDGPVEIEGVSWNLAPYFAGEHVMSHGTADDQRARGRLLAEFHQVSSGLVDLGQRPGWCRCEEMLSSNLDNILAKSESERPEEVRLIRWHLDRVRDRIADLALADRPSILVHGDFTPWNLRFVDGRLSGILDFELAHLDHRVADFSLSWRGKYDDVVHGYNEVSPLEPAEWSMITPVYWTNLINIACNDLQWGYGRAGMWAIDQLRRRSPLMGPDAEEYR